jgi:hypothetical protein
MIKKVALPLAAVALMSLIAAAPQSGPRDSFLPPNNLKIPISAMGNKGISRAQYDAVMDQIQAIYGPIIEAHGAHLTINRLWDDETVNASAQQNGNEWVINMYGGLARHPTITQDGMALVACHELGHHLGGAPKYGGTDWAANEGEADYFANSKCLHRMFKDTASAVFTRQATNDELAKAACASAYKSKGDRAVCERSAAAGMSVTELFRALRSEDPQPRYDTPDPAVVTEMYDGHPGTQCRLDTYYQGSLCAKSYTVDMSPTDPSVGGCTQSTGFSVGLRPRCWYLPGATDFTQPSVAALAPSSHEVKSPALASLQSADAFKGL